MEDREMIKEEIKKERLRLEEIQDELDFRDGGVFLRLFCKALILDTLIFVGLTFTGLEDYKKFLILLLAFLLIFVLIGNIYKKRLIKKKDRLIKERIRVQKKIVALSKKLG